MASKTLGRIDCPIHCGFDAAHVKLKTDKAEGKTAFPYVHCPSCGTQLHTKTDEQAGHLLKRTRAEKLAPEIPPTHSAPVGQPEAQPVAQPLPDAKPVYGGRFGSRP